MTAIFLPRTISVAAAAAALAMTVAAPAPAQTGINPSAIGSNLPTGSPLGAVPIILPRGEAAAAPSAAPDPFAKAQEEQAARFRAEQAYRARQAALEESARPLPAAGSASGYVDLGRLGDDQLARQGTGGDPAATTVRGPLPSPFGGGIPSIFGGGIRTPWRR